MNDYKLLPKLSQNLLEILNDEEYYDITIEVGNDPYVKIFRAHMVILCYRSPYLKRILSTNKKKNDGTLTHIKLSGISPENFHIILRYIYGGRLSLEEYDISDIVKILDAASKLSLQELINYIQSYLVEKKANLLEQNFNFIYQTSFENDSFLKLQEYCTDLISKEPVKIFKSLNFSSISGKLLTSILQSDNLQTSEIQVWEYVIKWGLAQNPELSSDPTKFSDKVLPYMEILPKELYMDLLKTFLSRSDLNSKPNNESKPHITKEINSRTVDSKIITYQHVELISKWIDRLEITDWSTPYEFKLLFRGSRDGFTSDDFHKFCDSQSCTVTVAKVKDTSEILGGYNPIAWRSDSGFGSYDTTKDSFIFSFKNNKIENYILSRVIDENHAIYNSDFCGPTFGNDDLNLFDRLFSLSDRRSISKKNSYDKSIRETEDKFYVEECEVFQIV
ncbi:hypothetical protein C1645_874226 [Glomus cerebriforme]|uniref:BTB/POZ domain-containing protein n=1 Tax=Glomus cerebriforme TaxID=658196 RepID=A0A397T8C5_9GLOM|nr:hypothetical protein C1645_874226 [Glomus cerebriforme]